MPVRRACRQRSQARLNGSVWRETAPNLHIRGCYPEAMQLVHRITEASAASSEIINLAHIYSSLNRKMMPPVDKKGVPQVFHVKVEMRSTSALQTATLFTASNSYVTKQAVKAWYRVWRKSLRDAGVTLKDLGPYGRYFKPRLTGTDSNGDGTIDSETRFGSAAEIGRGEWNYSQIVVEPGVKQASVQNLQTEDVADKFDLHLCGASAVETDATAHKWTSVGMLNSWLDSRKKPIGPDGDDVPASQIWGNDNPLVLARMDGQASELMQDEVRDTQGDEAPYDEQDLDGLYSQAILSSGVTDHGTAIVSAPCGLMAISTESDTPTDVVITLQGITSM